jgi:regulator of sigma E protease
MSYVLAFLGFVALIVLHEAGHFVAAKAVGMRVERFSLFFGPMPLKWRRGETEYGVGVLPLGGYVKISGMNPHEELPPEVEHRAYYNQKVWKRIVVILAGPAVNLVIAFLIVWGIFLAQGHGVVVNGVQQASHTIAPGSLEQPAARYLRAGDRIVAVDGRRNLSVEQVSKQISSHHCAGTPTAGCHASTPVRLTIAREGHERTFTIVPRYDKGLKRTRVGFGFTPLVAPDTIISAAGRSVSELWHWTSATASTVARVFVPKEQKQLHSFVGAFKIEQQAVGLSATAALLTIAVISLSLAVINLFPFLPLDGGHVFWALAEKIRGRRIPFSVMERAGFVGFALILFVFVIGLSNDISTLTGSGFNIR